MAGHSQLYNIEISCRRGLGGAVWLRRAGSNPPSVFAIFRYAAHLDLRQDAAVPFGLAPRGSAFSCPFPETSGLRLHRIVGRAGFCAVASRLRLPVSGSRLLPGGRSFLCRGSISRSGSPLLVPDRINFTISVGKPSKTGMHAPPFMPGRSRRSMRELPRAA